MEPVNTVSKHTFRSKKVSFEKKSPNDLALQIERLLVNFDNKGVSGCIEIHFDCGVLSKVYTRYISTLDE